MALGSTRLLAVYGTATAGLLACGMLLWVASGQTTALQHFLGVNTPLATPLARTLAVTLSAQTQRFEPRVTVAVAGSRVTFDNNGDTPITVRADTLSPWPFQVRVPAGGHAGLRLDRPGLYHYYQADTTYPRLIVAGNTVMASRTGHAVPRQGWIAVLNTVPGLQERLTVPRGQDIFAPKVVVGVVGSTITISNHDADTHNFVVDPASPSGAAFVISGTAAEPPSGWQRALVVQQPGLYHVYCTMHTHVVGVQDGWHVVAPQPAASGYADRDPMEAWIVVLPATATV